MGKLSFGKVEMGNRFTSKTEYVNILFESDCLELMERLPDNSVDMVLCDLPYGITQNTWDVIIPFDKLWAAYDRVVKPSGAVVLTAQGLFSARLMLSNEKNYRYKWIWSKGGTTGFLSVARRPLTTFEEVLVFYRELGTYNPQMTPGKTRIVYKRGWSANYKDLKEGIVAENLGLNYPRAVLTIPCVRNTNEKIWHPTQKPLELCRYLIRTYTNPGDVVLDNTCGSGSSLVSALMEERNFIGIEKFPNESGENNMLEVSRKRLRQAFMEDTKIMFSKNLYHTGVIKEFLDEENVSIT